MHSVINLYFKGVNWHNSSTKFCSNDYVNIVHVLPQSLRYVPVGYSYPFISLLSLHLWDVLLCTSQVDADRYFSTSVNRTWVVINCCRRAAISLKFRLELTKYLSCVKLTDCLILVVIKIMILCMQSVTFPFCQGFSSLQC
jgi:hypothetical protein